MTEESEITAGAPVHIIAGPTGAGKSALALDVAHALGPDTEIISADSMQIYRGMDIGTAKPPSTVRTEVPHHCMDIRNPDEAFSAADFAALARAHIDDCARRGAPALVVGGAGLYIRSMLDGLFACPDAAPEFRRALYARMDEDPAERERLYEELQARDPDYASRIHPHDAYRIVRALEIVHVTGHSPSELARTQPSPPRMRVLYWLVSPPRDDLYATIATRAERMFEEGLVDEVEALRAQGFGTNLRPMQSLGYRHATAYIEGACSRGEAVNDLARDTRHYAKRQLTWFRGELARRPALSWCAPDARPALTEAARAFWGRA